MRIRHVLPLLAAAAVLVPTAPAFAATGDQTVTVTVRDRNGGVPDAVSGTLTSLDGAVWDHIDLTASDKATLSLPPGEYGLTATVTDGPESIVVSRRFTVAGSAVSVPLRTAKAVPVGAVTERPSTLEHQMFSLAWGENGAQATANAEGTPGHPVYVVPTTDPLVRWQNRVHTTETGGDGVYRLEFHGIGVPTDMTQEVADSGLAALTVDYPGFGAASPGARVCFTQSVPGFDLGTGCDDDLVDLPTSRTEYLTATPGMITTYTVDIGDRSQAVQYTSDELAIVPGPGSLNLGGGAYGYGVQPFSTGGEDEGPRGMYRNGDLLYFNFEQLATTGGGRYWVPTGQWDSPMNNTAVITKDGTEINRVTGGLEYIDTGLPEGDSGRYGVHIDSKPSLPYMATPKSTTLDWTFNSTPGDDYNPLAYSAVIIDATGVRAGTAPATTDQTLTLNYVSQAGGTDAAAQTLTLEISYDDGTTWTTAALNRTGDTATTTLHHPNGAEHVSVRTTATDDLGSAITQTTIRSWILT